MALQKELTEELFGSRCRQYEFILIKLDQDRNLIVRRKRDGLALTTKFQEPVRRTLSSGTYSPEYRCYIMIRVFKYFTFEDLSYEERF